MFYQCTVCEQIYEKIGQAITCCPPFANEISDDDVVFCWRCRGDGCKECFTRGIMLVRAVRARDELAMATIRKYASTS